MNAASLGNETAETTGRARNSSREMVRGVQDLDRVEERGLVHHGLDGAHPSVRLLDGTRPEDLVAIESLDLLDLLLPDRDLAREHLLEVLRDDTPLVSRGKYGAR